MIDLRMGRRHLTGRSGQWAGRSGQGAGRRAQWWFGLSCALPTAHCPLPTTHCALRYTLVVRLLLVLLLALPVAAAEVRVFAAASLTDAVEEIARAYRLDTKDVVVFNFGASSMLARQIEAGAPADVLLSADDIVRTKRLGERTSFLSNTLVIVVPREGGRRIAHPRDLVGLRVALAEPATVPAGIYARTYLEKLGLWTRILPNVIPTDNVRAALSAVEAGNVDAAIVYRTDARISKEVRVAYAVPRAEGPRIAYLFATIKDAENPPAARRFFRYLRSPKALAIFKKHGFDVRN